jgi:glycosyltransferase involved in cell wall biosynthesis
MDSGKMKATQSTPSKKQNTVSIVVPIYNEQENINPLYKELIAAMMSQTRPFDLIFVDDGSRDGTFEQLQQLARKDRRVKLVLFRRNYGQTAAMFAGIQNATGEFIVTLDGDLQNDPRDIPMMLDKLEDGYDLVHGWRKNRQDHLLSRKIPSRIANWLIARTTNFPINDLGCTLKAIRREIAVDLELHGEMHRFIPILAHQLGARCVEVVTHHRVRQFGETKYGIGRTTRVVLDLLTVKFMLDYFASPMKLFGKMGMYVGAGGVAALVATGLMKVISGTDMTGNPLLLIGVIAVILSVQFFSLGLIGEVCSRIYYSASGRKPYQIRHRVNFDDVDGQVFDGDQRERPVILPFRKAS